MTLTYGHIIYVTLHLWTHHFSDSLLFVTHTYGHIIVLFTGVTFTYGHIILSDTTYATLAYGHII